MTATKQTGFDVTATSVHLPDGGGAMAVDCTPALPAYTADRADHVKAAGPDQDDREAGEHH